MKIAMARLIWLAAYRKRLAARAPEPRQDDRDLVPMAIVLWVGSVVRVVMGMVDGEVFRTEATMALGCVIVIPLWLLHTMIAARRNRIAPAPNPSLESPEPPPGARVIPLMQRRSPAETSAGTGTEPLARAAGQR